MIFVRYTVQKNYFCVPTLYKFRSFTYNLHQRLENKTTQKKIASIPGKLANQRKHYFVSVLVFVENLTSKYFCLPPQLKTVTWRENHQF